MGDKTCLLFFDEGSELDDRDMKVIAQYMANKGATVKFAVNPKCNSETFIDSCNQIDVTRPEERRGNGAIMGGYWCTVHDRAALNEKGCDPKLGGIAICCRTKKVE